MTKENANILISACLMGAKVRHDGGHIRCDFAQTTLDRHFRLMPVCPEQGMGMPVPRPALRIVHDQGVFRLVESQDNKTDHSNEMEAWAESLRPMLEKADGFLLAARSPSCGLERVKTYTVNGDKRAKTTSGLFAAWLKKHYPALPLEDHGRINDPVLRERFLRKVMVHRQWRKLAESPSLAAMQTFFARQKFTLMACNQDAGRQLGRDIARLDPANVETFLPEIIERIMLILDSPMSRGGHVNAMQHLAGFIKRQLKPVEKIQLQQSFDAYRSGHIPLVVPLTLLRNQLELYPEPYALAQSYLAPYPREMGLTNAI